jgi:hypothetical protein
MHPERLEYVVRHVVRSALEESHTLLPQDRRYADPAAQRAAKDAVAHQIAQSLKANGFLPADESIGSAAANYRAVSFSLHQMRRRLLDRIGKAHGSFDDQRDLVEFLTRRLFDDLEQRGWRIVRTHLPAVDHSTTR